MNAVSFVNVSVSYPKRSGIVHVLENLNFSVSEGEVVAIIGPSGVGKSTIARLITGVMLPTSGTVRTNGTVIPVFQDYGVFPWMTAIENVLFALRGEPTSRSRASSVAQSALRQLGLSAVAGSYPHTLSGGMRQRVGLARVFASSAPIVVLDEPLSAVDEITREVLQDEIQNLIVDALRTIILVTHSIEEALYFADRILLISGSPGVVHQTWSIPFGRPRNTNLRNSEEFLSLKQEIRGSLSAVNANSLPDTGAAG